MTNYHKSAPTFDDFLAFLSDHTGMSTEAINEVREQHARWVALKTPKAPAKAAMEDAR